MHNDTPDSKSTASADNATIRQATRDDLPGIRSISNWAILNTTSTFKAAEESLDHWTEQWKLRQSTHPWLVAEVDGIVTGYALAVPFNQRCGYSYTAEVSIYIDPSCHGHGLGTALYQQLISQLKTIGFHTAVAVIALPNEASEGLHSKLGFCKSGQLTRVGWKFDQWLDIAYWQLTLATGTGAPRPLRGLKA